MDLPRLDALKAYHKINPPLHIMVAAYLGVGEKANNKTTNEDLDQILASFPQTES